MLPDLVHGHADQALLEHGLLAVTQERRGLLLDVMGDVGLLQVMRLPVDHDRVVHQGVLSLGKLLPGTAGREGKEGEKGRRRQYGKTRFQGKVCPYKFNHFLNISYICTI